MYKKSRITIDNDVDAIEGVIVYIRCIAGKLGLNEKENYRICYAVEESLSNSILFDFEPDEPQSIDIDVRRIPGGMQIVISDQGVPRNPFVQRPGSIEELASDLSIENLVEHDSDRISAVSDFVIHTLLDGYSSKNLGKSGRSTEMVLYASEARVGAEEETGLAEPGVVGQFTGIRPPLPENITAISRLFYMSYGYSYVNDAVYYPERLKSMIETGDLTSYVAFTKEGRVIGHIALVQPFEEAKIAEWGMAICDPLFRGQGVMTQLVEMIMEQTDTSSYHGVFCHSVTNHGFTQKICQVYGFSDVALLIGYAGAELSFKKIHRKLDQRETTIISFKPLGIKTRAELFLPEQHKEMIETLYGGIGVSVVQPMAWTEEKGDYHTEMTDTIIPALNIAEVVLGQVGLDAIDQIRAVTKKICVARVDVIYLFIDLEDIQAVALTAAIERFGYFFGGIFPRYNHQHTLVMQYANNLTFNYELITAFTPLAQQLKKYIQEHDPNQII